MKTIPMPKFKTDVADKICNAVVVSVKEGCAPVTLFINWTTLGQLRDGVRHSAFYERQFRHKPERFMGVRIVIDHSLPDGEFKIRNRVEKGCMKCSRH